MTPNASAVGEAFRPPAAPLPPWLPVRRRNRLPLDVYREPGRFFVTISTEGRRPWFRRDEIAAHCIEALRTACGDEGFSLEAFCCTPDHVHLLVYTAESRDLVRFVHRFKQQTGWWFRNRYLVEDRNVAGGLKASPTGAEQHSPLWQKSYYDHVLRREEDLNDVVQYIMENPVKAGLTRSIGEYPYAWSAFDENEPA